MDYNYSGNNDFSMANDFSQGNGNCFIQELIIMEVPPQQNQSTRPYHMEVDTTMLNKTADMCATHNNLDYDLVGSTIGSGILKPASTPGAKIDIVNGWSERRFVFTLTVRFHFDSFGTDSFEIISGYTSYNGLSSLSGRPMLDPNMDFVINSITPVHVRQAGNEQFMVPDENTLLISSDNYNRGFNSNLNSIYSLAPGNVLGYTSVNNMPSVDGMVYNTLANVKSVPSLENRNFNNPVNYTTELINGFRLAQIEDDQMGGFSSNPDFMSNVQNKGKLYSKSPLNNRFLTFLGELTNKPYTNSFTISDLTLLDPTLRTDDDRIHVLEAIYNGIMPNDAMHANGSDYVTLSAIKINTYLPSIMCQFGIATLQFNATNEVIGQIGDEVIITGFTTTSRFDLTPILIEKLKNRIANEILTSVSENGLISYNVIVDCSLIGNTSIMLGVQGQPPVPYILPTYADSLFAPIITTSKQDLDNLSSSFNNLGAAVRDGVNMTPGHQPIVETNDVFNHNPQFVTNTDLGFDDFSNDL